jgi:acyl-CoA synthetase (AMP-forming)/AMP-acid ligase II
MTRVRRLRLGAVANEDQQMPLSGPPLEKPIQLSRLLGPGLEARPDEPALVSAETRWTWRELDQASSRLAGHLLGFGLRTGDRFASLMPNRTALLVHYLACMKAGLVAIPLNFRYMPPEIDHALEVSGASILFAHAERGQDLAASKLAAQLPLGRISYGAGDARGPSFEELVGREPPCRELPTYDPAAPAFIFLTSGSTGPAKGVTHSFQSLGWMFASTAGGFELTPQDVLLPGSSISHLGGFLFSFAALSVGARRRRPDLHARGGAASAPAATAQRTLHVAGGAVRRGLTTAPPAPIFPRCGCAAPAVTRSRPSWSASSPT